MFINYMYSNFVTILELALNTSNTKDKYCTLVAQNRVDES